MSTNNDDDGVEMFLSQGSYKPIILPSASYRSKHESESKRRWKLLKNVARFTTRRSSLTPAEQDLLHALSEKKQSAGVTFSATQEKQDDSIKTRKISHRQSLRQSILRKSHALNRQEADFLQSLVLAENVPEEQLEKVQHVLSSDPLYDDDNESNAEVVKQSTAIQSFSRPKLNQEGPSFRKEVWLEYTPKPPPSSTRSLQEEEEPPQQQQEERTLSLLDKLFGIKQQENPKQILQDKDSKEEKEESTIPTVILATHVHDTGCYPHVLSPPMMDALRPYLPFCIQQDNYWLKYSLLRDGASMRCLLSHIRGSARTILAIETLDGNVFGSFTSSPWRPQGRHYYGSGEAFCWKLGQNRFTPCDTPQDQIELESNLDVYPWTGQNRNVQSLETMDSHLVLGGGGVDKDVLVTDHHDNVDEKDDDDGSALVLDPTLERGTTQASITFGNPPLVTTNNNTVFEIANIEVWTMTPVQHVSQAMQLELGRQFIFDHGNFVEQ